MSLLSLALFRPVAGCCLRPTAAAAAAAASALRAPPRRNAGHSRWQNVRADKEAGSAQKRVAMANFTRLLRKAVLDGNGSTNPQSNFHLKAVFDKAKSENIPLKTLERMLAAKSQEVVEPYAVEVRGRGGLCVLVQCNSPTRTKCRQEIAGQVKRVGLEVVGVDSQISRSFFDKKGCIEVALDPEKLPNLDRATELALEFDCSDVKLDDAGSLAIFDCDATAVASVSESLRSAGLDVIDAGVRYEAFESVAVDQETEASLRGLYDRLRDGVDGVVQVFDNVSAAAAAATGSGS